MKDFDGWSKHKKRLERYSQESLDYREFEVWWCALGVNIGHEQDGKHGVFERPVLIVKKFSASTAWVIPMSSKIKSGHLHYVVNINGTMQSLILSQLRLVSVKRFRRRTGKISSEQWQEIRRMIINLLP